MEQMTPAITPSNWTSNTTFIGGMLMLTVVLLTFIAAVVAVVI